MNDKIDQYLTDYSKVNFQNDLENLEDDVFKRLSKRQSLSIIQSIRIDFKNHLERCFGMPASVSASAFAMTLAIGMFMGTQVQNEQQIGDHDALGLSVFSATNSKLPSSLLAPEV
ncbi:MAG: hypothetical protein L3J58_11330 [Emcibacter sp.]|nr:hypothetical protein [Emcibacter sp.]